MGGTKGDFPLPKVVWRDYDFFEIIKLIDKKFYKLKLFDFMNRIHDVFHMFLLKPYKEIMILIANPSQLKLRKILSEK